MKIEVILCNHRALRQTAKAKEYGKLIIFLSWLFTAGMLYSMTL